MKNKRINTYTSKCLKISSADSDEGASGEENKNLSI